MLLGSLSVLITLAVGYAYLREGLFTACTMFVNVLAAGLVAFNFWEPLADMLDPNFSDSFLHGYEDCLCLVALFCVTLGVLRLATNYLGRSEIDYPQWLKRGGGFLFGAATGYLVAGFLLCCLQTLPWHENFMFFDAHVETGPGSGFRKILPPDRVWLALMHRAGAFAFANEPDEAPLGDPAHLEAPYKDYLTFDKYGTFELRYSRYRRHGENRGQDSVLPYEGAFDQQLNRGR